MSPRRRFVVTQVAVAVPLLVVLYLIGVNTRSIVAAAVLGTVLAVVRYRTERAPDT